MKEYRVKISVRNNLLLRAIEEAGFKSPAAFERINGFRLNEISELLRLKKPPIGKSGEFSETAKRLMECLGAAPSDLWTDEQLYMAIKRSSASAEVGAAEIRQLLSQGITSTTFLLPDAERERNELSDVVDQVLASLTKREAKILNMRMKDDMTLEEIGKHFGRSRDRIRQIEATALRKLRHPSRADKLRGFLSYETFDNETTLEAKRKYSVETKVLKNERLFRWPAPRVASEGKYMQQKYVQCPTNDLVFDKAYRTGMCYEIQDDDEWDLYIAWMVQQKCDYCGTRFADRVPDDKIWLRERDCGCRERNSQTKVDPIKAIA